MTDHSLKLVLLPGLDGTGRFFARLQRCLGNRFALQAFSYPADRPMGYDELIDYVRAQIGTEPAVVLGEFFQAPSLCALPPRIRAKLKASF